MALARIGRGEAQRQERAEHAEHTEQRFVLYTPLAEEDTPAKMERLLQRRTVAASR